MENNSKMFTERVPDRYREAAGKALQYFPELRDVDVRFRYTRKIKKSVMVAQPVIGTMFNPFRSRAYVIKSSPKLKFSDEEFKIEELPEDVLIGWLVHELGHIMDYRGRSFLAMIWFGMAYVLSKRFMMGAERRADEIAIGHGAGEHIMATKKFILEHASIHPRYKKRIQKLYMAPEEAMEIINNLENGENPEPTILP